MLSSIERGRFGLQKVPFWLPKHGLLQPKSIAFEKHVDFCIFCGLRKNMYLVPKSLKAPVYKGLPVRYMLLEHVPKLYLSCTFFLFTRKIFCI